MRRAYLYRLYPTEGQIRALEDHLWFACRLYNAARVQRMDAYRLQRKSLTYYDQCRDLTEVRQAGLSPEGMACNVQQETLHRLDRAFQAFFRRVKAGEKPGFPTPRPIRTFNSLTWRKLGIACSLREGRLVLQGIGAIEVRWHRPIPIDAKFTTVTVRRTAGRWYVSFSLDLPEPIPEPSTLPMVGLDLGINCFARLSTGEGIQGPRAYREAERKLRLAQRRVSRRTKGSNRRRKAVLLLARAHEHVRNVRREFAYQVAHDLFSRFSVIAIEDLTITNMIRSAKGTIEKPGSNVRAKAGLNRAILDQAWTLFAWALQVEAEEVGGRIVKVPPRHTSQTCSECGVVDPASRITRDVFRCVACGFTIDADTNASRVILALALAILALEQVSIDKQAQVEPSGANVDQRGSCVA